MNGRKVHWKLPISALIRIHLAALGLRPSWKKKFGTSTTAPHVSCGLRGRHYPTGFQLSVLNLGACARAEFIFRRSVIIWIFPLSVFHRPTTWDQHLVCWASSWVILQSSPKIRYNAIASFIDGGARVHLRMLAGGREVRLRLTPLELQSTNRPRPVISPQLKFASGIQI